MRRGAPHQFMASLQPLLVHRFEHWFVSFRRRFKYRGGCHRYGRNRALGGGCGTKSGLSLVTLQLAVEFLYLCFELRNLAVERFCAIGKWITLFFGPRHEG